MDRITSQILVDYMKHRLVVMGDTGTDTATSTGLNLAIEAHKSVAFF